MESVGTIYFPCILQAHTSLKCAIASMCPFPKKKKSMPHSVPKPESYMILASIVHETRAGTFLRHPFSLLLLGSKAEVVPFCPEHGEGPCCSQYAHRWWDWDWSGTFSVFKILIEQGDFYFTARFENFKFFFDSVDRIRSPAQRTKIHGWGPCSWGSTWAATRGSVIKLHTATQLLLREWGLKEAEHQATSLSPGRSRLAGRLKGQNWYELVCGGMTGNSDSFALG